MHFCKRSRSTRKQTGAQDCNPRYRSRRISKSSGPAWATDLKVRVCLGYRPSSRPTGQFSKTFFQSKKLREWSSGVEHLPGSTKSNGHSSVRHMSMHTHVCVRTCTQTHIYTCIHRHVHTSVKDFLNITMLFSSTTQPPEAKSS